jgi:hypothetical protein
LVYYRDTTFAPSQFQLCLLFRCFSLLISFLFFPIFQSTFLSFFYLPAVHVVICPWCRAGLRLFLPPHCFVSHFYIVIYLTDFYLLFSLFCSSNLLPLSLCPCSWLHNWVLVSPGPAHGRITVGCDLCPFLLFCFGVICLLNIPCTFVPVPCFHYFHVDVPPHSCRYKLRFRTAGFLVGYLTLEGGTDRWSRNVCKEIPLLAAK